MRENTVQSIGFVVIQLDSVVWGLILGRYW